MAMTEKKHEQKFEQRLVRDEKDKHERWQLEGFQRLDNKIVMYRRYVPVTRELNSILMQIYDFNAYQMTIVLDAKGYGSNGAAAAMQVVGFSAVENKQALKDAHQALTDLGGNPPPISVVLGTPDLT
jgi:hypothetical protein